MRTTTSTVLTAVCALALVGCGSAEPVAQAPVPTVTTDAAPAPAPPPTPTPTWTAPTDLPAEVMLPKNAWDAVSPDDSWEESQGVVDWIVEETCGAGSPAGGVAMRTARQGSGEYETRFGVHQVVVLADADAAVAEADRLAAALTACPPSVAGGSTSYVVEPLEVGAQGIGVATRYYAGEGSLDTAMGTYLAVTRRGNAVTLVAVHGGEGQVGTAREVVTANAQAAWELLCSYDSAGC
jgi:hypothetical protein